jgi:hypothetical protein
MLCKWEALSSNPRKKKGRRKGKEKEEGKGREREGKGREGTGREGREGKDSYERRQAAQVSVQAFLLGGHSQLSVQNGGGPQARLLNFLGPQFLILSLE